MLELSERLRIKEVHWGQVVFYTWQDRLERTARRYLDLLKADLVAPPPDLEWLETCLETIRAEKVEGDLAQCGGADDAPVFMRGFLQAHEISSPKVWVFDAPSPNASSASGAPAAPAAPAAVAAAAAAVAVASCCGGALRSSP